MGYIMLEHTEVGVKKPSSMTGSAWALLGVAAKALRFGEEKSQAEDEGMSLEASLRQNELSITYKIEVKRMYLWQALGRFFNL